MKDQHLHLSLSLSLAPSRACLLFHTRPPCLYVSLCSYMSMNITLLLSPPPAPLLLLPSYPSSFPFFTLPTAPPSPAALQQHSNPKAYHQPPLLLFLLPFLLPFLLTRRHQCLGVLQHGLKGRTTHLTTPPYERPKQGWAALRHLFHLDRRVSRRRLPVSLLLKVKKRMMVIDYEFTI